MAILFKTEDEVEKRVLKHLSSTMDEEHFRYPTQESYVRAIRDLTTEWRSLRDLCMRSDFYVTLVQDFPNLFEVKVEPVYRNGHVFGSRTMFRRVPSV